MKGKNARKKKALQPDWPIDEYKSLVYWLLSESAIDGKIEVQIEVGGKSKNVILKKKDLPHIDSVRLYKARDVYQVLEESN